MRRARTPSRVPAPEDDLAAARDLGIDTCGRIAEFWGFTRTMGRAFGLLYLSPDPLTQAELQKRLGISAGSASMTLAALISRRSRSLSTPEIIFQKSVSAR